MANAELRVNTDASSKAIAGAIHQVVNGNLQLWKIFEIESLQSRKLFFTNLSECSLPKFMDNGFGESNCCPSGVPNSLVYGLQFCCPVGNCHPRLDGLEVSVTTPRKTASL